MSKIKRIDDGDRSAKSIVPKTFIDNIEDIDLQCEVENIKMITSSEDMRWLFYGRKCFDENVSKLKNNMMKK